MILKKIFGIKYSIYFLIFLILAKSLYLLVEIYYNGYLLEIVSSPSASFENMRSLEKLGHIVSSVGITLLIIPVFYYFSRIVFQNYFSRIIFIMFLTYGTFVGTYHGLQVLMNKIVDINKDKRYNAYYTLLLKYGMLNGYFSVNSYIPRQLLIKMPTDTKIMISNIFLLTFVNQDIIDKMITLGKNNFAEMFIKCFYYKKYLKDKKSFHDKMIEIINGYNTLINETVKFKEKFSKINSYNAAETLYLNMLNETFQQYKLFLQKVKEYHKSSNPSPAEVDKIQQDLTRYFRYQNYSSAQKKYTEMMYEKFGHYINPQRWCHLNICPDRTSIYKVIHEEMLKKWRKNFKSLPPRYITLKEFRNNPEVKEKILQKLSSKGIILSKNYDYSKKVFIFAYRAKLKKMIQNVKLEMDKKYYSKLGIHVKPGMTYKSFVNQFKPIFKEKYGKYSGVLIKFLLKRDDSEFLQKFYIPYFQEVKMKQYLPVKKVFYTDSEYINLGNKAIKLLFIPPFAIIISLLAGILNFISLILLFLSLNKYFNTKKFFIIKTILKISLLFLFIFVPVYYGKKHNIIKPYQKIFEKIDNKYIKDYENILIWVITLEKINYEYIYPYVKGIINNVPNTFTIELQKFIYRITFVKE